MTIANAGRTAPFGQADTHWEKGSRPIDIAKSQAFIAGKEVHVWLAQIGPLPACKEVLSQEEVRQAASFRSPHDQHRYRFSHRLLRFLLAAYIEIQPTAIHFQKNRFGKPSLLKHDIPFSLEFNMSHSRDHVCCVFARNRAVGIDLEFLDPVFEWDGVGQAVFSREEQNLLKSMPEAEQHRMFFQLWTRKEAQLKALGLGLPALDLEADRAERFAIESLQLLPFCYQDHYVGTVATDSDRPVVRFCSFKSQDAFMT
ncbi:4'-phosphopantetheinyl transferase superfamily protein [Brevibacillus nitrificans]|uniref:4'-phosphopantetheinyl transferase family protein n=1 Tax=Brevibacillus TaxID=55080 RepID=UPI002861F479|nr:4'-phosphopantetheinyl transferase superfamily protein [Brevibacillus nitrificans]MDR7314165.1 phosphopantetheinyl transferase [Brevibacillus nitrificans]